MLFYKLKPAIVEVVVVVVVVEVVAAAAVVVISVIVTKMATAAGLRVSVKQKCLQSIPDAAQLYVCLRQIANTRV